MLLRMKKSVNTIIQNSAGKYLLQVRDGTEGICNPLKWNFFGGGLSDDEDPLMGAARETWEELSVQVKPSYFELLGDLQPQQDRFVYAVRCKQLVEWQDITVKEGAGAGYFTKDELFKIDITDNTRLIAEKFL